MVPLYELVGHCTVHDMSNTMFYWRFDTMKFAFALILGLTFLCNTVFSDGEEAFLKMGYFDNTAYVNPSLGLSISLPQWEAVQRLKQETAHAEKISLNDFAHMNIFLLHKYPQSTDNPYNPEIWLGVYNDKVQTLKSFVEKTQRDLAPDMSSVKMEKGKIADKEIFTITYTRHPMDQRGQPLYHLDPVNRKIVIFKKEGLVGEVGILYWNDEQEQELNRILETIKLW